MTGRNTTTVLSILLTVVLAVDSACGATGAQLHKLLPDDGHAGDVFGTAVAISGTTVLVGRVDDDDNGSYSGSAYLFDVTTGNQLHKLLPHDGAARDEFGRTVAISGNMAIVGSAWDDDNGEDSGSAYLFDVTTGAQLHKLLPDDGAANDQFGCSVAISGSMAIVGSVWDDDNGGESGSAYLFDVTTGNQLHKLLPSDGAAWDVFGNSVAISGNTAIVASSGDDDNGENSGSAYLFDVTTGNQIAKLLPNDGGAYHSFGTSAAIDGNTVIVANSGSSAYLFNATTGSQLHKLLPDDGAAGNDSFGIGVAISGNTAIVGKPGDDDNGQDSGSAYLFDVTTGNQIAKLIPGDPRRDTYFGHSVGISGNTAIVGAPDDDYTDTESGSAYLFDATNALRGDTDGDGDIDTGDLTTAIQNFTGAGGSGKGRAHGDTDDDGDVDTGDLTFSIQNFTGAQAGNARVPDLVYDPATGNVTIDADGADVISFSLQSGPFNAADFSELPAGLTDNISSQIGWTSFNLFSGLTGTANLGAILPAGLDQAGLEAALATASYGVALAGGGGGGRLDLIIPEPAAMMLVGMGVLMLTRRRGCEGT